MATELPSFAELVQTVRHPIHWYREGGPADRAEAEQRRKRIRLVASAVGAVLGLMAAGGVYAFIVSLEARSEQAYLAGEKLLRPTTYEQAIAQFDRAILFNGQNEKARLARGEALDVLGRRDEALKEYTKVIEIKPNWQRGYAVRGKLYGDAGDKEKALEDLNRSVQLEESPEALFERGQVQASLGQWQKAIDDYTRFLNLREGVPYVYDLRAMARKKLGDEAGAREDKIQALVYFGKLPTLFGKTMRDAPPEEATAAKPKEK